jgi:hypothetical protein
METPPQIEKNANNTVLAPDLAPMAYRYKRAYEIELKRATPELQKRVLSKADGKDVDEHIRKVAALAEGSTEL